MEEGGEHAIVLARTALNDQRAVWGNEHSLHLRSAYQLVIGCITFLGSYSIYWISFFLL